MSDGRRYLYAIVYTSRDRVGRGRGKGQGRLLPSPAMRAWMKYGLVAIVGGLVGGTVARWPAPAPRVVTVPALLRETPDGGAVWQRDETISDPFLSRFEQTVGPLRSEETPLLDAVEQLAEAGGGMEVAVDPEAAALLEGRRVTQTIPPGTPLYAALDYLADDDVEPATIVEPVDGRLWVTTADRASELCVFRAYDVEDLVLARLDRERRLAEAAGGHFEINRWLPAEELVEQVRYSVRSTTWLDNGGSVGSGWADAGATILVFHTPLTHYMIERELASQRAFERARGRR